MTAKLRYFTHSLRLMGYVTEIKPAKGWVRIKTRSGGVFQTHISSTTGFFYIKNLDKLDRDRSVWPPEREPYDGNNPENLISRYIQKGRLVSAYGVWQLNNGDSRFDAKEIWLFQDNGGEYLFEQTHWWLTQITSLADRWLLNLFGEGGNFDFSKYQTNLSFIGTKSSDVIQECATLSRLIYGLSSAYLMTGNNRYYEAAKKGVEYQRDTFRSDSHDGSFVVWSHAYDPVSGSKILPSRFDDDRDTIPLYEQIYALAGLTQFYRITNDWETLNDIYRTICFFQKRYYDPDRKGFFSHVDYANLEPNSPSLGDNCAKKNWNSIGDHTPAYLLNLLLAIRGLPGETFGNLYKDAMAIQNETADLIIEHFPDPDANIPFVRERFTADWQYDPHYKWQQDRAVCGHNLKIAWNLCRIFSLLPKTAYKELAVRLGESMKTSGLDQVRGGWFDVVERCPRSGMPYDFVWHNRKAWWQQEQGILAYLILYGLTGNEDYRSLARESIAYWNMTYLDFDYGGVHFDVTDDGLPYTKEVRALKGSHSKSGYHVFELNYLANIYIRTFISKEPFRLYFRPCDLRDNDTLNVLPDYLPRGALKMGKVSINGEESTKVNREMFSVHLVEKLKDVEVAVEFIPNPDYKPR